MLIFNRKQMDSLDSIAKKSNDDYILLKIRKINEDHNCPIPEKIIDENIKFALETAS